MMFACRPCIATGLFLALLAAFPAAAQTADNPNTAMLWQPGDPGERLFLRGRVVTGGGQPVGGATVYLRQADGTGVYTDRYQTRLETAADGSFSIATVLPGQYRGVKHIHMAAVHDAYPMLQTRVVFKGDPNLTRAGARDLVVLLEEVRQDGETVLVGDLELVLPTAGGD